MQKEMDCLSPEAQKVAEARLAAKRAARAEAREIRMKELERQQKEIYQVQKKYYGLDTKWGDIEQWMEDSERYSRRSRRNTSASDEDERMSVGSRGSLRSDLEYPSSFQGAELEIEKTKRKNSKATNGYDGDLYGSSSLNRKSSRNSSFSGESRVSTKSSAREEKLGSCSSDLGLSNSGLASKSQSSSQNGNRPSFLYSGAPLGRSYRAYLYDESIFNGSRRCSVSNSRAPSEYTFFGSGSRASSRASSARASPVVEERPEKDFLEKGGRNVPGLSAATLASLGGTSSRRGSGDTSISVDTETSIREIKEINELKDQIQDVEGKYMQGLKEMKDSLAEVEEKYKKAMVSNAQLDNEKMNFMYQVDTLKDAMMELEEQLAESRRQYEEKNKEFEREKHAHNILQFQFAEVKEALKQREEMLAEIRQLQQKNESYVREISDLQETIEWKDKKIGALERQKEFFDSIRSERDDLRDEVNMLKEELKKHGIILNSEDATNGEISGGPNYDGPLGCPAKAVKEAQETAHALKGAGDETLGRTNEVEMKNEILENVGKREILQNTEHEQHKEDTVKDFTEIKTLHPDENAESKKTIEDNATSPGMLANSENEEQIRSEIPEGNSFPPSGKQVEFSKDKYISSDKTLAFSVVTKESDPLCDLNHENLKHNQETPGTHQHPGDMIVQNESQEFVPKQQKDQPEDLKPSEGKDIGKLCPESGNLGTSEVAVAYAANESQNESVSLVDSSEVLPLFSDSDHTLGEQEVMPKGKEGDSSGGAEAGDRIPPDLACKRNLSESGNDTDIQNEKDLVGSSEVLKVLNDLEKDQGNGEALKPKESLLDTSLNKEDQNKEQVSPKISEEKETELKEEALSQTETQRIQCSPAESSQLDEVDGSTLEMEGESPNLTVALEEKDGKKAEDGSQEVGISDQQEETIESSNDTSNSSQKKTKNKKKKNKKKKALCTPSESFEDVKSEVVFHDADLSEVKEKEQVEIEDCIQPTDKQDVVAEVKEQETLANTSMPVDCPEKPKAELEGRLNLETDEVKGQENESTVEAGEKSGPDDETISAAEVNGPRESDNTDNPQTDSTFKDTSDNALKNTSEQSTHECKTHELENEEVSSRTQQENTNVSEETSALTQGEITEEESEDQIETAESALDSIDAERMDDPVEQLGKFPSGSKEDIRGGSKGKGKNKEDCMLS
ncbi:leucine-rich repeat flightless-interacting protein 1 isoform X6 [Ornithorhynchus anatinus]|uniref:leucine-rich repeat flightless-interacting protein 1 isoform X6 n=1 Tax=Ornithorhynchus anatinus TaxID=9258 RepID=UPI0010A865C5|nr:leucine-rich repeat flightless-interacting protein 1 isoform X6 [Ornithorhynchus anatinus]